jgi:hypothetical protein
MNTVTRNPIGLLAVLANTAASPVFWVLVVAVIAFVVYRFAR